MIFFDYLIVILIDGIFIYLFVQLRRKGKGGNAHAFIISCGAIDAFYHNKKKKAIEMIADRNAQKKWKNKASPIIRTQMKS